MFKRIWAPELIEEHILSRQGKEPLNSYYYSTNYPSVYAAAERMFGSWGNAITACGLDYDKIRKYRSWSHNRVLNCIREIADKGIHPTSQYAQRNNKKLYMAAIRHFRSWGLAVQSAGIDYSQVRERRSLNEKEIRQQILELYQRGEDLSYSNMRKKYQYLLAYGMRRLGNGSWAAARQACGIETNFHLIANQRNAALRKK